MQTQSEKRNFWQRFRIPLLAVAAVVTVAVAVGVGLWLWNGSQQVPTDADKIDQPEEPAVDAPTAVRATVLEFGRDLAVEGDVEQAWATVLDQVYDCGFNAVFVPAMDEGKTWYTSTRYPGAGNEDLFTRFVAAAHKKTLTVFVCADPLTAPEGKQYDVVSEDSVRQIGNELADLCSQSGADGVLLTPTQPNDGNPSYTSYRKNGGSMGYDAYRDAMLGRYLTAVASAVRTNGGGVCVGVQVEDGEAEQAKSWTRNGGIDFLTVLTVSDSTACGTLATAWSESFADICPLYFRLPSADSDIRVAEITARCVALMEAQQRGFVLEGAAVCDPSKQEWNDLRIRLNEITDEAYGIRTLMMQSPSSHTFTTYVDSVSFIGASDVHETLTLNGEDVPRTDTGYFSVNRTLKAGENKFEFCHKGKTEIYTVTYSPVLIRSIYPDKEATFDGGCSVTVSVVAKAGCEVKARLGKDVVTMTGGGPASADKAETFVIYSAAFTMPSADTVPVEVGELIVSATKGDQTETKAGGKILVRAVKTTSSTVSESASAAYESGYGIQVGVGDRYVAEVVDYQTETLEIITPLDERSRPTNAYLPQGTVDYCTESDAAYLNPDSGKTNYFRNLRYGKRVYSDDNIKIFKATLPETNTVTAVKTGDDGRHTTVTLDVAWKAPFQVTLAPQSYKDPFPKSGRPLYDVDSLTYQYVDIEFCYTVSGQGKVDVSKSGVFRSAEWVKASSGNYVLRLWLKQTGAFYGWTASYNEDNQLVFSFLDPYRCQTATNAYGATLNGSVIVIDAGHGGKDDPGAVGSSNQYTEAVLNLILAKKVQRQLEDLGATVVMTRTDDSEVLLVDRARITTETQPDLFISIHRNGSTSTSARGYDNFYFYPFSKPLNEAIYNRCAPLFTQQRGIEFYPYYVCRVSCCPAILTENGFMTNGDDLETIKSDSFNDRNAEAIVRGIVDYFKALP